MSHPLQVGANNQILTFTAYLSDGSVKTDLVAADITALLIKRIGLTNVTGTGSESDKTNPNDTHTDWAIYSYGNGQYTLDAPDAALALFAAEIEVAGTWTDGSDSGYLVGDPYPLVNFDWASGDRSLTTAATTAIQAGLATIANQATILNRIGAFTGTGVNTILGFFKAIMFSDAAVPSDAGDTFESSLEEVKSSAINGVAGGSTTTISLGVASMRWWITTDSEGNNVIASGTTQEAGTVQALLINGNTYYMWARKLGYNDLIAYSFVAVAD